MTYSELGNNQTDIENSGSNRPASPLDMSTPAVIHLLEERLLVNLTCQKAGEIVVRKVVDTKIINVNIPVRREKLIVDRVAPTYRTHLTSCGT